MRFLPYVASALAALTPVPALSQPMFGYGTKDTTFYITAWNPENRSWNCSAAFTLYDDSQGVARVEFSYNENFVVTSHTNNTIVHFVQARWATRNLRYSIPSHPSCF